MEYSDKAVDLFKQGCNCAQAVFCAFCEEFGINFDTGIKLSSSFGGGMGGLREVCGAVSALFMIAGLKYGYSDIKDINKKTQHYKLIQDISKKFSDKFGTIICKELLANIENLSAVPSPRTAEYYKVRPCVMFVEYAARLADEILNKKI